MSAHCKACGSSLLYIFYEAEVYGYSPVKGKMALKADFTLSDLPHHIHNPIVRCMNCELTGKVTGWEAKMDEEFGELVLCPA